MENDFDLQNLENFRINPTVWLHTLLAIAGDKDQKEKVIHIIAQKTGFPPEKIEMLMSIAISELINQTRTN
jgi:hypothetical protein